MRRSSQTVSTTTDRVRSDLHGTCVEWPEQAANDPHQCPPTNHPALRLYSAHS